MEDLFLSPPIMLRYNISPPPSSLSPSLPSSLPQCYSPLPFIILSPRLSLYDLASSSFTPLFSTSMLPLFLLPFILPLSLSPFFLPLFPPSILLFLTRVVETYYAEKKGKKKMSSAHFARKKRRNVPHYCR